ncbi:hypothetical protein [Streptomyces sp. CAU 1734]|uniref:hypothetical protein n=1 Tax=Streptomyces sp. CAU 1734 TaxID=3140360 RepID=UPI0032619015
MVSRVAPLLHWSGRRNDRGRLIRLEPPPSIVPALGCDAVGMPARHGFRLLAGLPRNGCVFADADWWWWMVPAGSDQELTWPLPSHYAEGADVPGTEPQLIHWPDDRCPYTPPIPLYLLACQLTGTAPLWTAGVGRHAGA